MPAPVFPTKWHFLAAEVLFGVREGSGELLLGQGASGTPAWVCWTDLELAQAQLHPGYVLRKGVAREVLPLLPAGVEVMIDPGAEHGMSVPADYADALRPLTAVFPAGVSVSWEELVLPIPAHEELKALGREYAFLDGLWTARFRLENGPDQAAVVYRCAAGPETEEAVVDAIVRALDRSLDLAALPGPVVAVQVIALADLTEAAQRWVEERPPVIRRG